VLDHGCEHVKAVMLLLEDYIVVGNAAFLQEHSPSLLRCLRLALGVEGGAGSGVAERGLPPVVRVMETLLVGFPEEGARALIAAGIHDRLLQQSLGPSTTAATAASPPGGGGGGAAVSPAMRVQFLSVLARSLLTAPGVVFPYLQRWVGRKKKGGVPLTVFWGAWLG
jgi:hypothetical protein